MKVYVVVVDLKGLFYEDILELICLICNIFSLKVFFMLVFLMGLMFIGEIEFKEIGIFYIIRKLFWYIIFVVVLLEMIGILVRVFMKKINLNVIMLSGRRFLVVSNFMFIYYFLYNGLFDFFVMLCLSCI